MSIEKMKNQQNYDKFFPKVTAGDKNDANEPRYETIRGTEPFAQPRMEQPGDQLRMLKSNGENTLSPDNDTSLKSP